MSLLLEALKKAELAKHGRKPEVDEPSPLAIQFEPAPPQPDTDAMPEAHAVITRKELPDISQPLEILSEDLPSAAAKRAVKQAAVESGTPTPASQPQENAPSVVSAPSNEPSFSVATPSTPQAGRRSERDAVRQLFEAKEVPFNPNRSFYIIVGVLLAIGAGYGGYLWWQLRPKTTYNPATVESLARDAPAAAIRVGKAPSAQAQATPADARVPQTPTVVSPAAPPAPTSPAETGGVRPAAQPAQGPVFARSGASPAVAANPPPRASAAGPARSGPTPIAITPPTLAVDPVVERAYAAYQRGDLALAHEAYRQVLQRDPLNRDALLGMAAIDVRARSYDTAEMRYLKLLELDPRDVAALAGLMALHGHIDPVQSESRLKTLIAASPDAAQLHFALGNQYAQQSRWAEAQAAYFKAHAGDPENADFAFNLAISLDQLRQKSPALQYYHLAIALAAIRPGSFDPAQANVRIQELQRQ